MPFRRSFDCLWCGVHHEVRSDADLEGWASLCPECIGRADDNGFLRTRLRAALSERSAATAPAPPVAPLPVAPPPLAPSVTTTALDDWYLRRGRFSAGPIIDQPWQMELDEATRWLDAVPLAGTLVELAAGAGWWSTLLASKGELWMFDSDEAALELARQRLVAHDLLAHLHVRDPLAPPQHPADAVFAAVWLGAAADERGLRRHLDVARRWLRPGGLFVFIDVAATDSVAAQPLAGPRGPLLPRSPETLLAALTAAGFESPDVRHTPSVFVMGQASAPA